MARASAGSDVRQFIYIADDQTTPTVDALVLSVFGAKTT